MATKVDDRSELHEAAATPRDKFQQNKGNCAKSDSKSTGSTKMDTVGKSNAKKPE